MSKNKFLRCDIKTKTFRGVFFDRGGASIKTSIKVPRAAFVIAI